MSSKKWIVLGISGATCSGKTSLANRIHKELKNSVLIHQDDYFLPADDPRHTKVPELNAMNWELITSIDMDKLRSDVLKLLESLLEEEDLTETNSKKVLILDGFKIFDCKVISNLCDRKYFLTLNKEQCWKRRQERTYNPPDVPGYFEMVVWPEYLKHKNELTTNQDLQNTIVFIDGLKSKQEIFETVFAELKELLA